MYKFESLTNNIVGKNPSKVKAKGKKLRQRRHSDDGKKSSEPSSDSKGELEKQTRH